MFILGLQPQAQLEQTRARGVAFSQPCSRDLLQDIWMTIEMRWHVVPLQQRQPNIHGDSDGLRKKPMYIWAHFRSLEFVGVHLNTGN